MTSSTVAAQAARLNRLASATSPYLRQHATNPVDWYPWGEEALALARESGKPILLSIGYSACHWCHVMAHESFEDPATAAVMNELFVNIKVDREERPDLDKIYQLAHHLLTQRSGGWPLTMFLTHDDQRPFFGGTYFPNRPRYGMPAFVDVLKRVAAYYREHAEDIRRQNDALVAAFAELAPPPAAADLVLNDAPLRTARRQIEEHFDPHYGGTAGAPKFPHPTVIERLLRDWHATARTSEPDLRALYMAALTLKRMAEGGIHDQLGGGFARYSVDEYWMIPHFEKMLYDNGALLACYAEAALATGEPLFLDTARRTARWLLDEMRAPQGGFFSSYDADSEGHEGRYYLWQRDEVRAQLTPEEYAAFAARYGLDREPNFEGTAWHLHCFRDLDAIAKELGTDDATIAARLESAREKLRAVRRRRVPPALDDKILTSWNALAIRGLALAARAVGLGTAEGAALRAAAEQALAFLRRELWRDGRLLASYKDGAAQLPAYLDDYALLLDAILTVLQQRWDSALLHWAHELADVLLARFADPAGGFYFTADDHERLFHRSKSFGDDATPNGNGIAAQALQRLGYLCGEPRYLAAAEATLRAGWAVMTRAPYAHTTLLTALEEAL
ncbi:MAG: thioredoxin domain-containing protein, partial [Steroidobacteraceae bacterium]|nr:thioredoxin domain-containing protein [Steroidobacteraceae bacterium]